MPPACHVVIGRKDNQFVVATDKGYGFITKGTDLQTRNKAGKALITCDDDAVILQPLQVCDLETDCLAVASKSGRLLIYKLTQLPSLAQGKGNKLMNINGAKLDLKVDGIAAMAILPSGSSMIIHCGKRVINLSAQEIEQRISERTKAGDLLPRGFQKIDSLEVILKKDDATPEDIPPVEPEFTLE